jgi:hypothetical protein
VLRERQSHNVCALTEMKTLVILDAPWYVPNDVIRNDLGMTTVEEEIKQLSVKYSNRLSKLASRSGCFNAGERGTGTHRAGGWIGPGTRLDAMSLPGIEPWAPSEWPSHFLDLIELPPLPLLLPPVLNLLFFRCCFHAI